MGCNDDLSEPLPAAVIDALSRYQEVIEVLWGKESPDKVYSLSSARETVMSGMDVSRKAAWHLMLLANGNGLIGIDFNTMDLEVSVTKNGRELL